MREHKIPEKMWLSTLESTMDKEVLQAYQETLNATQHDSYEEPKKGVMRSLGPGVTRRYDKMSDTQWRRDEITRQMDETTLRASAMKMTWLKR